jgi:hypothetical protein
MFDLATFAGCGVGADREVIRAWWSLRSLVRPAG